MEEDAQALEEVVSNCSGYFRDKKSWGYSTQEVQGEDLNTVLRAATLLCPFRSFWYTD